jgi:hypothetical protein
VPVTQHDAEEALRPYLGRLHDAIEDRNAHGTGPSLGEETARAALDKALELLGVQR